MKTIKILALAAAALALASCGASKKAQQNQYPYGYPQQGYYQQPYQPQYQPQGYYQPQTPVVDPEEILRREQARMAEENPCQYIAANWPYDEIRAYGEATGFDEESARVAARINAEAELNNVMNLWASDFTRRTNTAAQANGNNNQERLMQQDQIRFAEGDLKGVQVLLVKYEKQANGVLCRMCVKMNANAATQALLSQAQVQGVIDNAEKFRKEADEAREEIRLMRTGSNAATTKQQIEFNQQMQNQQMQNQQQLQQQQLQNQHHEQLQQQQNQHNQQMQQQYYNYRLEQQYR